MKSKDRSNTLVLDIYHPFVNSQRERLIRNKDTKLPSSTYTHVFTNFAIFALPKPDLALKGFYNTQDPMVRDKQLTTTILQRYTAS